MIFVLTIINNVNDTVRMKIICHYLSLIACYSLFITRKTNTCQILVFSWVGVSLNPFGMSEEEKGVFSISSVRKDLS